MSLKDRIDIPQDVLAKLTDLETIALGLPLDMDPQEYGRRRDRMRDGYPRLYKRRANEGLAKLEEIDPQLAAVVRLRCEEATSPSDDVARTILEVAQKLEDRGQSTLAAKYRKGIVTDFPGTEEAGTARELIERNRRDR